jgi:hypothetical protein
MNGRYILAGSHIGVGVAAFGVASIMGVLQGLSIADINLHVEADDEPGRPGGSAPPNEAMSARLLRLYTYRVIFSRRGTYNPARTAATFFPLG